MCMHLGEHFYQHTYKCTLFVSDLVWADAAWQTGAPQICPVDRCGIPHQGRCMGATFSAGMGGAKFGGRLKINSQTSFMCTHVHVHGGL